MNSTSESKAVVICWIPSNVGIIANDKSDSAAECVRNIEYDSKLRSLTQTWKAKKEFYQAKMATK